MRHRNNLTWSPPEDPPRFPNVCPFSTTMLLYTQDHIGAAGMVYDHFAHDSPTIIASKRIRATIKERDERDPTTVHGKYVIRTYGT